MEKQYTYHLSDLDTLAHDLLKQFNTKVVLCNGEMGAGKTTLIKALVKALGSEDNVTSPTFSIVNEYEMTDDKIYHFDFYRIEDIEEAYNFGVEDYFASDHWLFIEWSENVEALLPEKVVILDISITDTNKRHLIYSTKANNLTKTNASKQPG